MSFNSYDVTVDFEGVALSIHTQCRYVTRDEFGFVQGWNSRPKVSTFGGFENGSETPVTFGHNQDWVGSPRVIRKYRRAGSRTLIAIAGCIQ